ncbi:MAG: monovalent cation/H(+) antiporter subunit G [Actinomycetota bacterium]
MSPIASGFVIAGSIVSLLAGIGMIKFGTTFARFHAAGKASPVAFLLVAVGAGIETSGAGRALLVVVAGALILTLPVAVHLLFRAVYAATDVPLGRDDLAADIED